MYRALLTFPLLAATTCFAQTIIGSGCPVEMKAQQQAAGRTEWVVANEDAAQLQKQTASHPNSGVHVELNAPRDKALRQVELTVDFAPLGIHRMLPLAQMDTPATTNLKQKTFSLSATDTATRKLAGSLLVGPAASIIRVRLLSITYADGTHWQSAPGQTCSVEPSHFLLVDTH